MDIFLEDLTNLNLLPSSIVKFLFELIRNAENTGVEIFKQEQECSISMKVFTKKCQIGHILISSILIVLLG